MSAKTESIVRNLVESIKNVGTSKTSAFDSVATIKRIEGNIAWVHFDGGAEETPARLTIAAKVGDTVQVRVSDSQAFLVGNGTSPPTDDSRAIIAENAANKAVESANIAYQAAETAVQEAGIASEAASQAQASAEQAIADAATAQSAAESAQESAENAATAAEQAQADAATASTAATQAVADADAANDAARQAQTDATIAQVSASTALNQLSLIEDVVGTLNWISEHGNYEVTTDTSVIAGKYYFERSGTGTSADPYIYSVVVDPESDPSNAGYYELIDVDEAVSNFIATHMSLTMEGLWLQAEGQGSRILISPSNGVIIYGESGHAVARYGNTARIGDENGFHIEIDGTELGFYEGQSRVAYINNNTLHISQSVVLTEMQIGENKWTWKIDSNDDSIYLKWIG